MTDETDKLAAQMRNLKPSKKSRESGLDAAMAAFGQEFAPETKVETAEANPADSADLEKNSEVTQGLADEPRPTGMSTKPVRATTRRVETMTKLTNIFNFKPQTMMMAGTCSAALIAAMVVIPSMGELAPMVQIGESTPVAAKSAPVETAPVVDIPSVETAPVVEKPADDLDAKSDVIVKEGTPVPALTEPAVEGADIPVSANGKSVDVEERSSNVVTIERRVLKTPSRVETINVPAQYGNIERRTQISPERAEWEIVPGTKEDGSETYRRVIRPAEYESKPAQVILRQAGEELRVIPPVYETVKETIQINADGTTEVLSSEVQPTTENTPVTSVVHDEIVVTAGKSSAAQPKGGINSVDSLLTDIRQNSAKVAAENNERERRFRGNPSDTAKLSQEQAIREYRATLQQKDNVELFSSHQGIVSQTTSFPPKINRSHVSINPSKANPRAEISGRKRIVPPEKDNGAQAQSSAIEKVGNLTLEIIPGNGGNAGEVNRSTQGQFTVFNGTSNVVVQSTETIVSKTGEILCRVLIPAKYKTITKQVVRSPARTEERIVPAVTKDVTVKVKRDDGSFEKVTKTFIIEDAKTEFVVIPAKYETRSERVLVEPAREEWKPGSQAINAEAIVQKPAPPKYVLRDDDGNVVREFENRDAFEKYKSNLTTVVSETPVSTFSVDVDTASYSFLRASINRGQLPPRSSIRLEEMINYFPYDYEAPKSADEPFKANVTVTPNPWNADTKLMHIGIKGYVPPADERPNSNIVLLIDTSGSMRAQNKLPLLINSFKLLLNTLDEDDTVSIVTYAGSAGTVLEPTPANEKNKIKAALENLRSGGSTAGAAGLELAYNKALESFDEDGVNRVILATDGDFNVGFSSPDEMKAYVEKKRETGVFLSVLGFGMGNYNDHLMQSLAQNGNGVAAYIDTLAEANKVLANEAGSSLFTIAKDVKIQVEFNPSTVAEYRLIGYETRALKRQDFNNDKVDAGEIGAGHSVTAIYEMTPVGSPAVTIDKLRYVSDKLTIKDTGSDEYAFVKIRHKLPNADKSTLQTFPIGKGQERSLKRASDDMRFATVVAAVGQKLRGDPQLDGFSYKDAIKLAKKAKGDDEDGYRAEFIQMVKLIDNMGE